MEHKGTILSLNDDCLLHIFMMLDLEDQQHLQAVMCPRFEQALATCWRLKFKRAKCRELYQLKWIMSNLRHFLEELEIGGDSIAMDALITLKNYVFPKLKFLKIRSLKYYVRNMSNITDIFPNLTRLSISLCGKTDLRLFSNFRHLIDLEIVFLSSLSDEVTFDVFSQLRLKKLAIANSRCNDHHTLTRRRTIPPSETLEELSLDAFFLDSHKRLLRQFPKLRKIACISYISKDKRAEWFCFEHLVSLLGPRIAILNCNCLQYEFTLRDFKQLPKMRKLIANKNQFKPEDVSQFGNSLQNLRELRFSVEEAFDYDEEVFSDFCLEDIIAALDDLEILAVPEPWIDEYFLFEDLLNVVRNQSSRKAPLQLQCFQTEEDEYLEQSNTKYEKISEKDKELLRITQIKFLWDEYDFHKFHVSFEFDLESEAIDNLQKLQNV